MHRQFSQSVNLKLPKLVSTGSKFRFHIYGIAKLKETNSASYLSQSRYSIANVGRDFHELLNLIKELNDGYIMPWLPRIHGRHGHGNGRDYSKPRARLDINHKEGSDYDVF